MQRRIEQIPSKRKGQPAVAGYVDERASGVVVGRYRARQGPVASAALLHRRRRLACPRQLEVALRMPDSEKKIIARYRRARPRPAEFDTQRAQARTALS